MVTRILNDARSAHRQGRAVAPALVARSSNVPHHARGDTFNYLFLNDFYESIADAERTCSRNTYFWILPVEVLGNSPNTTCLGALKCAMRARQ